MNVYQLFLSLSSSLTVMITCPMCCFFFFDKKYRVVSLARHTCQKSEFSWKGKYFSEGSACVSPRKRKMCTKCEIALACYTGGVLLRCGFFTAFLSAKNSTSTLFRCFFALCNNIFRHFLYALFFLSV